ncbi:MAG: condensation domain-containing protein [Comamonadaceae bacterium]|nr:condensation domain-containing protein [Comamonadaceae bacterium]
MRGLDLVARPAGRARPIWARCSAASGSRTSWTLASPAYNLCSAFRVRGVLDVPRLQQSFERVASRHRLLRSTFRADGDTARQVVHERMSLSFERIEAEDNDGLAAAAREARRPFDLEHGPLVRVRLVEEASGRNRFLLLVLHHILADERSLGLLWKEVAQAYEGRLADTAPAVQHDDYVHWLEQAGLSRRDEDLAFWRRRLDPLPDELRLPFEQPARAGSSHGRLIERTLRPSVQAGIRNLATAAGATPFMVFAFAFRLLLHRYTDGAAGCLRHAGLDTLASRHRGDDRLLPQPARDRHKRRRAAARLGRRRALLRGAEGLARPRVAALRRARGRVVATPAGGPAPALPGDVRLPGGGPRTGARRGAARAGHARPGRIEVRPDAVRDRRQRCAADRGGVPRRPLRRCLDGRAARSLRGAARAPARGSRARA